MNLKDMKSADSRRWVPMGAAAMTLGVTPTHLGTLVKERRLTRHGARGSYVYDIVELLRLRAARAKRGPHPGRPTQLETLLRLKAESAQSITALGTRTKRMNRRATRGL